MGAGLRGGWHSHSDNAAQQPVPKHKHYLNGRLMTEQMACMVKALRNTMSIVAGHYPSHMVGIFTWHFMHSPHWLPLKLQAESVHKTHSRRSKPPYRHAVLSMLQVSTMQRPTACKRPAKLIPSKAPRTHAHQAVLTCKSISEPGRGG